MSPEIMNYIIIYDYWRNYCSIFVIISYIINKSLLFIIIPTIMCVIHLLKFVNVEIPNNSKKNKNISSKIWLLTSRFEDKLSSGVNMCLDL